MHTNHRRRARKHHRSASWFNFGSWLRHDYHSRLRATVRQRLHHEDFDRMPRMRRSYYWDLY